MTQKIVNENGIFEVHELCGYGVWSKDNKTFEVGATKELVEAIYASWVDEPDLFPGVHGKLNIVGAAPTDGQRTMLWEIGRQVIGKDPVNYPQEVGDCVSFGGKNAISYMQFAPMLAGDRLIWKEAFPPYLWGCGRIFIGKNQLGRQDGSVGIWQGQACMQFGMTALDAKLPNGASLPQYSGAVARQWGNMPGPSQDWVNIGKEHLVKAIAPVKTWDDYCQAIANGYPVTLASNVGFDMKVRSDGFHHYSTHWGHQLCGIGFDNDPSDPYGTILNSWGPDVHGVIKDFKTGETWPGGTLRVRRKDFEAIFAEGDSWAYSMFDGFPAQSLPRDLFNPW